MADKIKNFFIKNKYLLTAFIIPFAIMCAVAINHDFYPFGENQIAVIDMYHQYVPFLSELQNKLQTGGSLFYSWNGGAGTNFISMMAYYTASPLNLLLALIPQTWLMEGVTLIVFIKIGLAGMFMTIFLRAMYGREDWITVSFAVLYAMCAYVLGFYWCLMWLDAVALLPLAILGLNRLLDRGDIKLYVITLAIMMLCNYYIGGIMCIFILFYYPALYFSKKRDLGAKGCAKVTGKAVLCSFTGIFLAGILLVPTYLSLKNTYYINSEMPGEILFYRPLLDIFNQLLPQMEVTVRTGGPNLYCGLLCVMLFVFYLVSKEIPARKKMANCILLGFLILSLNVNKLDYIWHGMHFPNQIPFRYSFVVSFLLIIMAYEMMLHIKEVAPKWIAMTAAIGTVYVVILQKVYGEDLRPEFAYVTLLLLFMYSGFLVLYKNDKYDKKLLSILLLVMVIFEMTISADLAVKTVSYTNRVDYFAESVEVKKLVRETQKEDPDFYRIEMDNTLTLNGPMLYNYPGVSQFSSTVNADVSAFMAGIGVEGGGAKNRYSYDLADPVTNAILGIKYMASRGQVISDETSLKLVNQVESSYMYKNKYALAMGYVADPALLYSWNLLQENPYGVLNDYVKLATGTTADVFSMIDTGTAMGDDVKVGKYQNGYVECSCSEEMEYGQAEIVYTIPESQQVYAFVECDQAVAIYATRGDGRRILMSTDCGSVTSMGYLEKGDTLTITVDFEEGEASPITSMVYGMDEEAWAAAYDILSSEQLQVESHSDTHIEGTVTTAEGGALILSVPYEKGWSLKIDGQKVEPEKMGGTFISAPITAGTHTVDLKFVPDGTIAGIIMTLCGLGILICMCMLKRRNR